MSDLTRQTVGGLIADAQALALRILPASAGHRAPEVAAAAIKVALGSRSPLHATAEQRARALNEVPRLAKRASAGAKADRLIDFTAAGLVTKGAATTPFSVDVPILKSEQEEQFIYGVVLEPTKELNKPDHQDDIYSAEEVRRACHKFMADYRRRASGVDADVVDMGIQHSQSAGERIKILENFIAPCDLTIDGKHVAKGTWLLGAWVDSDIWGKVKKGEITGFSIGGRARRERVQ